MDNERKAEIRLMKEGLKIYGVRQHSSTTKKPYIKDDRYIKRHGKRVLRKNLRYHDRYEIGYPSLLILGSKEAVWTNRYEYFEGDYRQALAYMQYKFQLFRIELETKVNMGRCWVRI